MSRSREEWLALEDLRVWSFMKLSFLLSGLSIALGLLTLALLGDIGWAMLVFLATLILGISARMWQDRQIKRTFREKQGISPSQVIEEVKLSRRRLRSTRQQTLGMLIGVSYAALALLVALVWQTAVLRLTILLVALVLAPASVFAYLRIGVTAQLPAEESSIQDPESESQVVPPYRRGFAAILLIVASTLSIAAMSLYFLPSGSEIDRLRSVYLLASMGLGLWGFGLWAIAAPPRSLTQTIQNVPAKKITGRILPAIFAVSLLIFSIWLVWPV